MEEKRIQRKYLYPFISIIFGLSIALVLCEILLRILGLGYGRSGAISDPILHHVNPPDFSFYAHSPAGEFKSFMLKYNEDGFRQFPNNKNVAVKYRVALMGDSMTLARELPYFDTFSGMLQSSLNDDTIIYNFAVPSYSPSHYVLQWEKIIKDFNPTHVFLMLYTNDIGGDKSMQKIAVYSHEGKLIALPGPGNDWLKIQMRKSYVVRFIFKIFLQLDWKIKHWNEKSQQVIGSYVEENPEINNKSAHLVLQIAHEITSTGAEFILMVAPSKYRLVKELYGVSLPEFSDKWKKFAENNSIFFLDLVKPFQESAKEGEKLFFDHDIHFNRTGCEVIASTIKECYPYLFKHQHQGD